MNIQFYDIGSVNEKDLNDVLLVNCGSAIGHIFAQLSKVLGFRLIAITRNDKYSKDLLKLGASCVINTFDWWGWSRCNY